MMKWLVVGQTGLMDLSKKVKATFPRQLGKAFGLTTRLSMNFPSDMV
jgi:hypothetical protein